MRCIGSIVEIDRRWCQGSVDDGWEGSSQPMAPRGPESTDRREELLGGESLVKECRDSSCGLGFRPFRFLLTALCGRNNGKRLCGPLAAEGIRHTIGRDAASVQGQENLYERSLTNPREPLA